MKSSTPIIESRDVLDLGLGRGLRVTRTAFDVTVLRELRRAVWSSDPDAWQPALKGISVPNDRLPELIAALTSAASPPR